MREQCPDLKDPISGVSWPGPEEEQCPAQGGSILVISRPALERCPGWGRPILGTQGQVCGGVPHPWSSHPRVGQDTSGRGSRPRERFQPGVIEAGGGRLVCPVPGESRPGGTQARPLGTAARVSPPRCSRPGGRPRAGRGRRWDSRWRGRSRRRPRGTCGRRRAGSPAPCAPARCGSSRGCRRPRPPRPAPPHRAPPRRPRVPPCPSWRGPGRPWGRGSAGSGGPAAPAPPLRPRTATAPLPGRGGAGATGGGGAARRGRGHGWGGAAGRGRG